MRKSKFNSRKLMEQAVEAMRHSIPEPRADGKASPKVGALIWKADGSVETATRGELRHGDHAEFTLLERKNRDCALDGSVLFSTLEPCAPGARNPPKVACAERIVNARIRKVWVGIEDPDPKVDRKGIKFLQDSGVEVQMFDRDLQDAIKHANKEFISQALERAREKEKVKPRSITLSGLESIRSGSIAALSDRALNQYRVVAKIKDRLGSIAFNERLLQQGLVKLDGKRTAPTGFGLLLFGKEPRVSIPQAGLLATIHYPDGKDETRDFDQPLVLIPNLVEGWLRDKLPNVIDRSAMQRRRISPLPFEMIREAVVNALVHRDYDIVQGKCQLIITADTITVKSPGGPLTPITLKQLQEFDAPMLSRNPVLHYVFAMMDLAEERGLGLKSLKTQAENEKLPLPRYAFEDPYLVLTLFRNPEAATGVLPSMKREALNDAERKGWEWFSTKRKAKATQYAKAIGVDERTGRRHLNHFLKLGLVQRVGSARSTEYELK